MTEELLSQIDVDKRTTRGRSCPRCGGKIIPSDRAVYQASDPDDSFPVWQCERCGYEQMTGKKAPAKKAVTPAVVANQLTPAKPTPKPAMLDSKGRALPPDVRALMLQMEQQNPKEV